MGRPPLNVKPTNVRLPKGAGERIDAIAGEQNRAKFIREAILKELKRLEKKAKP
jgi:predicted DNA-binding protein